MRITSLLSKESPYQDYDIHIVMVSIASPLKGKRVGVTGFNARPIACSAKKAGASVFVSDYWGDDDLSSCCDSWIAILTPTPGARQRQPLDMPIPLALVDNLLYLTEERQLDMVLIGSGFDDYSEAIEPIEDMGLLVGCSTTQIDRARDYRTLEKIVKKLEIKIPSRVVYDTPEEVQNNSDAFVFPCVVRPTFSGGGRGVRLARSLEEVTEAFPDNQDEEDVKARVVQEYVSGVDVSSSILTTGDLSRPLSVQGQLIGMPTAGRNCDFAYCGNYYPSGLEVETVTRIEEVSTEITTKLELNGSIGLDFVVDDSDQIWLLEVNPRIQGTLELMEAAGNLSITSLHVLASNGVLPEKIPDIGPGVKMIVYSRRDGAVPDLAQYSNTVDRSPPGVMVNIGDPICTVIEIGSSMRECYRRASETALAIQSHIL
ncbi:MAG: ATP-grasp domain-containing protein [Candidatus Thorarchaeota archaeon]|jgi:predicted ATP-grasp superfamily ATP-dependent carboligase